MDLGPNLTLEELLGHADWLTRLAVHLAGRDGADDAVQETWLAARLSGPDRRRSPRPWLAEVLRNQIRGRWQRDARRRRREQAAALLEADSEAAVDAVYERLELHRIVAQRVMALEKPLRDVVLLRYFEGRDSSAIAALLRIPAGTVRWRLKTALDRLRAELNAEGNSRTWALAAVPRRLAGIKLAAVLLGLVLAPGFVLHRVVARPTALAPAVAGAEAGARIGAATGGAGMIEGRVLDEGQPVAGALVVGSQRGNGERRGAIRWTRTERDGRFRMRALAPGRYLLTAMGPEQGMARPRPVEVRGGATAGDLELPLARAEAGRVGRVLDAGAGPIARAHIRATSADAAVPAVFETQSACLGRYRLELPPGPYAIEIEADGYAPVRFSVVLRATTGQDFSLHPGARAAGRVVTGGDGSCLPGARLVARRHDGETYATDADDDGAFVFAWLSPGRYDIEARWGELSGRREAILVGEADRMSGVDVTVGPPQQR
jgi:RNA polymerase sigma-70 factor (ECF subfamily)